MPHNTPVDDSGGLLEATNLPLGGITLTPPAVGGDVDNYAPAGIQGASVLRFASGSAARNITGIIAPTNAAALVNGKYLLFVNTDTANSMTLKHASGSSLAGNRFIGTNATDVVVRKQDAVMLYYDPTLTAWIPVQI